MDRGSLTDCVKRNCRHGFNLKVHSQDFGRPTHSEQQLLKLPRAAPVIVREIALNCSHIPWIFARTLIPPASMHGKGHGLASLGNKSLGTVLFAHRKVQRHRVEITYLKPHHHLFQRAIQATNCIAPSTGLWARRTLFLLADKPLLVNEIFLPNIVHHNAICK